jgi:hypothetical protein
MLSKEDFVRRILDGAALTPKKVSKAASSPATFSADDVFGSDDTTPASIPPFRCNAPTPMTYCP